VTLYQQTFLIIEHHTQEQVRYNYKKSNQHGNAALCGLDTHYCYFNLKAIKASPDGEPTFPPPPAAITIYWMPSIIYVAGVA